VLAGSTVTFDVANPSAAPATVTFDATLPSATVVPHSLVVAGSSVATFSPSSTPGWPQRAPFATTVRASAPVVVGRTVSAPPSAPGPGRGGSPAAPSAATRWLVAGPGSSADPVQSGAAIESVSVADDASVPVRVRLAPLAGSGRAVALDLGPGQPAVVPAGDLHGWPLVVSATGPVVVEEDDGPSGAPGVLAWPGLPLPG